MQDHKEAYAAKIFELLKKCDDIEIFEIILQILQKYSLQKQ